MKVADDSFLKVSGSRAFLKRNDGVALVCPESMSNSSSNISCSIDCPADQSANMHLRTQLMLEIKPENPKR